MKLLIFINLINLIFTKQTSIILKLYTNISKLEAITLKSDSNLTNTNGYCDNCQNYFITHGFQSDSNSEWIIRMKNALFENNQYINVFVLDWSDGAITGYAEYEEAVKNINDTVRQVSNILLNYSTKNYLKKKDIFLDFHCIGHSLGAHVCGLIGQFMAINKFKFTRITGLDPAGPCFQDFNEKNRLSINDADYVDIIHTSKTFGFDGPLGHVDFYPNDGTKQPGCYKSLKKKRDISSLIICGKEINFDINEGKSGQIDTRQFSSNILFICSHTRSYEYFIESLTNRCQFISKQCSSWTNYKNNRCSKCRTNRLGFFSQKPDTPSKYYLKVNSNSPFCLNVNEQYSDVLEDQNVCSHSKTIESSFKLFLLIYTSNFIFILFIK